MRKSYHTTFFLLFLTMSCLGLLSQNQADALPQRMEVQKTYVVPERLVIIPEGIFYVARTGAVLPVEFISKDRGGLFILSTYCTYCGCTSDGCTCDSEDCIFNQDLPAIECSAAGRRCLIE